MRAASRWRHRAGVRFGAALAAWLAPWFGGLGLAVAVSSAAAADVVELGGGGQVEGRVVRRVEDGSRPHVVVEVDAGLRLAVPLSRVRKSTRGDELAWYRTQAAAAGDDAEAHYQLARQCKAKGLIAQRNYHFRRVIEIEPNHSKARYALGYAPDGNEWVPYEDLQRRRGLILADGRWQVPEVYMRQQAAEEANAAAKLWIREFSKLRSLSLRGGKRAGEALQSLEQIDDPLAAQAFAEALAESRGKQREPRHLRKLYVRKLAQFRTPQAVQALVKTGLVESDDEIRAQALVALQEYGASSAVATYLPILSAESHTRAQVTAALRALNYFPDPELWRQYVDALITTHKRVKAPGPGMNVGRSSTGGMGLSMGGKKKVEVSRAQNPGALSLLKQIAPGVDYRYDQAAWRKHFADQLLGSPGDLRRDG